VLENLRSAIDGVEWPAIPTAGGGAMLAALFQLEQSQWLAPPELWRLQRRQLARVLRHAVQTCPFYAGRSGPDIARLPADFTLEQFASLPLLTRRDVQLHFADIASRSLPPGHGQVHAGSTSGSTGQPVRYQTTDLAAFFWQAFNLRDHLWHRRDFSLKLATIRSGTQAQRLDNWFGDVGDTTLRTGPCVLIPMDVPIEEQARSVMAEDPAYLTGHANNLVALLAAVEKQGGRLPGLKQVRCLGEAVPEEARRYVADHWGVPLVDLYSTRESGYVALQCPDHDHYHLQAESMLVEVIDDAGKPCAPGETGSVVVTPLHNFAFPLIRYALGDIAEVGDPCPCGRGLPVLRRILGRSRNLMKFPDGSSRWPVFGIPGFLSIAPIRQFQFVQRSLEELEIRLAVERPLTPQEQQRFGEHVIAQLRHPFRLNWVFLQEIPRPPSGKFEDFFRDFD
jgi:phenylacetate-CoA ligase